MATYTLLDSYTMILKARRLERSQRRTE